MRQGEVRPVVAAEDRCGGCIHTNAIDPFKSKRPSVAQAASHLDQWRHGTVRPCNSLPQILCAWPRRNESAPVDGRWLDPATVCVDGLRHATAQWKLAMASASADSAPLRSHCWRIIGWTMVANRRMGCIATRRVCLVIQYKTNTEMTPVAMSKPLMRGAHRHVI